MRKHAERLVSLELERIMVQPGPGGLQAPSIAVFQSMLEFLVGQGWKAAASDGGEVLDKVVIPDRDLADEQRWSCTCDVTTTLFETTVSPAVSIHDVAAQQQRLDAMIRPALAEHELTLLQLETQPAVLPTRQLYAQTAARWRESYQVRATRGEDAFWASWTAGSQPCIDVCSGEAIRALRVVLRLTPLALLLSRAGSVTGGQPSPGNRMTLRPWTHRRVFAGSPHAEDLRRVTLPRPELRTWHDYFGYLLELPAFVFTDIDGHALRIDGDPSFRELWRAPRRCWPATSMAGPAMFGELTLSHLMQLQRQVFFTRPRWTLDATATLADLRSAYESGAEALDAYLDEHLGQLYLELRPDSPAAPGEDVCMLALWCGLLENLDEAEAAADRHGPGFWRRLMDAVEYQRMDSKVDGVWLPDLAGGFVELAERGLARRGRDEQRLLAPLTARIDRVTTPAEEILRIFNGAPSAASGIEAIHERYAWRTPVQEPGQT